MKKLLLLIITFFLTAQTIKAQTVVLDANGVTVKWTGTTVPNPRFVQASPRGTLEWFAIVNNTTKSNITDYAKNIQSGRTYFTRPFTTTPIPFNNIVTTLVTDMQNMFTDAHSFNQPIGSWNVGNVTTMAGMFYNATSFNQPIGSWNVSNVTDMYRMFAGDTSFNQPIGSWDVSNVTNMFTMFYFALAFNQPIENWNVSNVTDMQNMFNAATSFNQPISSWNVGNVVNMEFMFYQATSFNQPIGSWNVGNVVNMEFMFYQATSFNQSISSWDVSNVTNMIYMFGGATAFNQPISCWNVSNVTNMSYMFASATAFNQNIGSWNVSKVTDMRDMFLDIQLSTANFDALLIGWSTIGPNETSLKPNVTFSGGNSKYCNGATARNSIISTYGWTITSGVFNCINIGTAGPNCQSLDTDNFNISSLKLFPNPVLSILNVKVDSILINQPYSIVDSLGRVILKGNINDVDNSINVEQLSKGIYYLKVSDNSASKFVKE